MKRDEMTTKEKLEKMIADIKEKFGVNVNIFKAGGRWSINLEKGYNIEGKKLKDIRDYMFEHSEELDDDT